MLLSAQGKTAREGVGLSAELPWFLGGQPFSWNFHGFYS